MQADEGQTIVMEILGLFDREVVWHGGQFSWPFMGGGGRHCQHSLCVCVCVCFMTFKLFVYVFVCVARAEEACLFVFLCFWVLLFADVCLYLNLKHKLIVYLTLLIHARHNVSVNNCLLIHCLKKSLNLKPSVYQRNGHFNRHCCKIQNPRLCVCL